MLKCGDENQFLLNDLPFHGAVLYIYYGLGTLIDELNLNWFLLFKRKISALMLWWTEQQKNAVMPKSPMNRKANVRKVSFLDPSLSIYITKMHYYISLHK